MKKLLMCLFSVMIAVILLICNCAWASEGLTETDDNFFVNTDPRYEKIVERLKTTSHSSSFSGSVLLATDDEIIAYGGPKAVTTEGLPVDLYTTYDIGSCSKIFTAVAVFQLIEKEKIALDDPLSKYFPEYKTGTDITVYQTLHMQSGIADYVNDPENFWVKTDTQDPEQFLRRLFLDEVSDEELLQNLYAAPLCFEPGSMQSYSNTDYHLLALIVEQVSGMKLNEYLQEHVFDVCGMEHTSSMAIADETSVPKSFTEVRDLGMVNEDGYSISPNQERGAGGIHTCTADLWAFDKALLSGQLVSSASLDEIMHFDMGYGCGMYPCGKNMVGHSGRNGAYTTQNVIIESETFGRVYLVASTSSDAGVYGLDAILAAAPWIVNE